VNAQVVFKPNHNLKKLASNCLILFRIFTNKEIVENMNKKEVHCWLQRLLSNPGDISESKVNAAVRSFSSLSL